jgi:hypothetical protein
MKATLSLQGCAMALDAFFLFPDGLLAATDYGIRAAIQPGGSVRDAKAIAAAGRQDIAMIFSSNVRRAYWAGFFFSCVVKIDELGAQLVASHIVDNNPENPAIRF